ncbi:GUN4 domain-containing protein [Plectonema radiosum NIES-515]|uniref:GUN4 domain-containing protein n=1 Tax=Plectonema radiosum NIES-515 TaxID=2986073 RepID=A0ABT3B006_9CYAN|nr:GUN4 domain-containing protein [Plectonema radiosum]MCV3214697.1 GUN4 domain-containing protein [Plectonema radiosum NIES-515]
MSVEIPVKKILVLSANPKGTKPLCLSEEIREIKEGLQLAKKRDSFQIESAEAVRDRDIHRSILNYEPQIIHFSGHGAGEEGLIFEDNTGQQKLVDAAALAGLFELFASDVECVLLNACYSEIQAKAIAQHINYVIGMSQEIGDKAAIKFAVGFYDALGAGRSVEFAYKLGCQVIRMAGIQEHLTPKLLRKEDLHGESINTTPTLTSPPQDARKASVVSPSPTLTPTPPVTKQEEAERLQREKQKADDLPSEKGIDYTKLRDLLAAGNWKDADQETLAVMLKATGRETEGYLDPESIVNFPCTDLRTIDQLWVKYSKGLFGFSVQKRIYESVGFYYEKFGDRVGWRKLRLFFNKEWLTYSELTFSLNAPHGHLPAGGFAGGGRDLTKTLRWLDICLSYCLMVE